MEISKVQEHTKFTVEKTADTIMELMAIHMKGKDSLTRAEIFMLIEKVKGWAHD